MHWAQVDSPSSCQDCAAQRTGLRTYMSPMQRVAAMTQAAREAKRQARIADQDLEARWGAEGAAHMRTIRELQAKRSVAPQQCKSRSRKSRVSDVAAVRTLPSLGTVDSEREMEASRA